MHQIDLILIIKERREELKLTQEDLANIAGVGLRTLKSIESGKGNPTLETINKLLEVLGLGIEIGIKNSIAQSIEKQLI